MKILVISPKNKTVFNFRGDLIKDMILKGHEVSVTGPNQDYMEDVMALGVKSFYEVPFVKDNANVFSDLTYLKRLNKVVKNIRPDMIFGYTIKPVIYGSIAGRINKVKNIHMMVTGLGRVYTSDNWKTKIVRFITKILYRIAFKSCTKVIFQNKDDIEEFVQEKYLPRKKTELVNGSGVNMKRFQKKEFPNTITFLMVSRVIREKGVMEYCQAARALKEEYKDIRCVLLGGFDSSIGALKEEDIAPYIQDGSIEFPGEVKSPEDFYYQSSVFVLPSYYREGLPRTILEAMACGRAVITTDWPGCREAIEQGKNGILVPIKNSEALKNAMEQFVANKGQAIEMGECAYCLCKEKFEVSIINAQMRKIMNY